MPAPSAEHLVLAFQGRSCSRLARGLAIVLERTPAVPAVHSEPGTDPAAVALRVRPADVVLGYAVDIGQARILAHLIDVADDADVSAPAAFIEHVEGDAGIVAYVLERFRPSSIFTSIRPSSHRYQVAVATGWPSGRRVVMTAGFGLRNMTTAASGSGGFDMLPPQ
jgi:hypothetical protein